MSKPEVFTFCVQVFEDHFRGKMTDDIAFSVSALDSMEPEELLLESECVGSLTALVLAACERPRLVMASCVRDLSRLNEEEYS